jgi:hypothetical protein
MKKYTIHGEEKQNKEFCKSCKDGEIFNLKNESDYYRYYSDDREGKVQNNICGICLTKYKQDREFRPEPLNDNNIRAWINKIKDEVETMITPEILEEREVYKETGVCFENRFIKSKVKTLEGTFEIETCLITKKTKLTYNNKTYLDDLSVIINFLSKKGIEFEEKRKLI